MASLEKMSSIRYVACATHRESVIEREVTRGVTDHGVSEESSEAKRDYMDEGQGGRESGRVKRFLCGLCVRSLRTLRFKVCPKQKGGPKVRPEVDN